MPNRVESQGEEILRCVVEPLLESAVCKTFFHLFTEQIVSGRERRETLNSLATVRTSYAREVSISILENTFAQELRKRAPVDQELELEFRSTDLRFEQVKLDGAKVWRAYLRTTVVWKFFRKDATREAKEIGAPSNSDRSSVSSNPGGDAERKMRIAESSRRAPTSFNGGLAFRASRIRQEAWPEFVARLGNDQRNELRRRGLDRS